MKLHGKRAAPPDEDRRIAEGILSRDENALSDFSRAYRPLLLRIANNILNDPQAADECVNDCLLAVWNSFPEDEAYSLTAYSTGVLRRLALARLRDLRRLRRDPSLCVPLDELVTEPSTGVSAEDEYLASELASSIRDFLRGVSAEKRFIFVARYYECCSAADIAATLGVSVSSVHKTLARLRKELKAHLERNGYNI
ncbi:MAG: sigma-70 family RNA polymerase sigma factor [Clostridia bacterium]|nr:sigma-70 family RNA polymerase sigma factor [Clostridia bacterium]